MKSPSGGALRFQTFALENWKNFASVDVPLQRRMFIVGANASGKSNLLDVFRFLRDLAAPDGGFQPAVRRRGGVSAIRCLSARRYPDVRIRFTVSTDDGGPTWGYDLAFHQDQQAHQLVRHERVTLDGRNLLDRPDAADSDDADRLTQTHLEQVNVNREFRELVRFLQSVRYLHIVPQLIRDPERSVGRSNDPFGGDFLELLAKTHKRTLNSRLRRIEEALKVAVPQLSSLELERDDSGAPHLRGKYRHWRRQGAWQAEDQFSDGTLRLVGLLWSIMDGSGPLLLEEPELSLHPEIVRRLPEMLARVQRKTSRQILISTHSPELLTGPGIGLDETLLLQPSQEGTDVSTAAEFDEIPALLQGGVPLPEAVMPRTRPANVEQLTLFGDQ